MAANNQDALEDDEEALLSASGLDHRKWGRPMRAEIAKRVRSLLPPWATLLVRWVGWDVVLRYAGIRVFQTGRGQPYQCIIVAKGDYRFTFDGLVTD